jgi:hypothetical protein
MHVVCIADCKGSAGARQAAGPSPALHSSPATIVLLLQRQEEGTITTPFDMALMNDLDRFHLVSDTVVRLPQLGARSAYPKLRCEIN